MRKKAQIKQHGKNSFNTHFSSRNKKDIHSKLNSKIKLIQVWKKK